MATMVFLTILGIASTRYPASSTKPLHNPKAEARAYSLHTVRVPERQSVCDQHCTFFVYTPWHPRTYSREHRGGHIQAKGDQFG